MPREQDALKRSLPSTAAATSAWSQVGLQRYCHDTKVYSFTQQKRLSVRIAFLLIGRLAMSYSHMGTPTLPSALLHFTSEFGMESGGSTALLSLSKKITYRMY